MSVGSAYSPDGFGISDPFGDLFVGSRFSIFNTIHFIQSQFPKLCSLKINRDGKLFDRAVKVGGEFIAYRSEEPCIFNHIQIGNK